MCEHRDGTPSYAQQYNYIPCGRSNERPYEMDDGRMWGWCEGWYEAGTRRGHYN
ncbi:MAG: hypothetical protein SPH30_08495 [Prevotella sp.]|nr:hypothetical protein [Prevotella sp.]